MSNQFVKFLSVSFLVVDLVTASYSQPNSKPTPLTTESKNEIVSTISQLLLDNYVYPDTALLMSNYILKNLSDGKYKDIDEPIKFTDILNNDISTVIKDEHFRIVYNPRLEKRLLENNDELPVNIPEANFQNQNSGIVSSQILNGNIGLIEMRNFVNTSDESNEAVKSALTFLAHTNAIIFDIRTNGGGSGEMVHFITSFFFGEKIHLIDMYSRPARELRSFYTEPDSTEKRFINKPVYILTSPRTASAAEEFAYNMKVLKRATVIGQSTAGAAHGTFERPATNGVVVYIPYARMISAVTKTDWEHVGVEPDIQVSSENALETAQEKIVEELIKTTTDSSSLFDLRWQYSFLKAANNPLTVDEESLKKFCGVYGERTLTLENGDLYYQRLGRPKFKMKAMTSTIFTGDDFFKIEFIQDTDGNYNELIAYYADQRVEKAKRTK